jgi:hypothetical protein
VGGTWGGAPKVGTPPAHLVEIRDQRRQVSLQEVPIELRHVFLEQLIEFSAVLDDAFI